LIVNKLLSLSLSLSPPWLPASSALAIILPSPGCIQGEGGKEWSVMAKCYLELAASVALNDMLERRTGTSWLLIVF